MAFGSLLSGIKDVVDGNLPFGIGGAKRDKYPNFTSQGQPKEKFTNKTGTGTEWRESLGYSFHVVKVSAGRIFGTTTGAAQGWKEFRLQINPQELTQDEIFAVEVTPTLRGILVEHHGSTLKDITISGTTGISPNRKEAGTNRDGSPIFATGHSGYKEFHDLRSYFRLYVEEKRLDSTGNIRLVFRNYKDNEFLYVEPTKFTMKRSARKPMMYDYVITLKAVGIADRFAGVSDWKTLFDLANNLDSALEYIDQAVRTINGAFGIINRFQRDINSILLAPLNAVTQAVRAIQGGVNQTLTQLGVTKRAINDLKNIASRIQLNFSDAVGRDTSAYNAASGRTQTIVGNPNRQTTYDELSIINALSDVQKGLLLIAALGDDIFEQNVFEINSEVTSVYGDLISLVEPSSVASIDILATDDIQTIAAREFGDPDKFRDIVLLNNLKPPYISATPEPGLLSPGSKILVPRYGGSGETGAQRTSKEFNITKTMVEAEKGLGVDIRINEDGDLAISNTKDLDLVAGMSNMAQASALKLGYESGSLKRHPGIGTDLQIGRKAATSLTIIREQILSSFQSDNRVESIPFIELIQEGGAYVINMLVKLKNVDQPVPIPLKVNAV